MAEFTDAVRPEQTPDPAAVTKTPPPAAKLYDAARNKQWGVATLEDIQVEFSGNQEALAGRIRQDKAARHKRTWHDLVERTSEGVRMKVLKQTLEGTKRSTETMVRMTGYSAPTTQQRIQLADFFVWAAPELHVMWERSQIETEPGKGVRDFEMPSDRIIIEMGQAAAKKAGCWGLPQMLLITSAHKTVEAQDLPKAIGWDQKRRPSHPFWEDKGMLAAPWQDFHLFTEVRESGRDPEPSWCLDLFVQNGKPVTFNERGFVVRWTNGTFAGAADALNQLKPHVSFLAAQKAADAAAIAADLAGWPVLANDKTGKRHVTLEDIAAKLNVKPNALVERLHSHGYLNLQGEATPAALDDGITTINGGGTQFSVNAIQAFLEKLEAEQGPPAKPSEPALPTVEPDPIKEMVGLAATDESAATDASKELDPPLTKADAAGKPAEVLDATKGATVWSGSDMQQVTAPVQDQRVTETDDVDQPISGPGSEICSDVADTYALGMQAVERLQSGMQALLAAETAAGRRTEAGEFVPHSGDNQTLRNRIKMMAQETAKAYATLTNSVSAYKALLESVDRSRKQAQRLEVENTELKHRAHDDRTEITALESKLAEYAEVVTIVPFGGVENGATIATSS